jgi:hypothetical protein
MITYNDTNSIYPSEKAEVAHKIHRRSVSLEKFLWPTITEEHNNLFENMTFDTSTQQLDLLEIFYAQQPFMQNISNHQDDSKITVIDANPDAFIWKSPSNESFKRKYDDEDENTSPSTKRFREFLSVSPSGMGTSYNNPGFLSPASSNSGSYKKIAPAGNYSSIDGIITPGTPQSEKKFHDTESNHSDSNEEEKIYKCPKPFCTKTYKNPNGLKYHVELGNCEIVEGTDLANQMLATGAGIGITQKPFVCVVTGCDKRYKNISGLKYHIHAAHRDLDCKQALKKYRQLHGLPPVQSPLKKITNKNQSSLSSSMADNSPSSSYFIDPTSIFA